MTTIDVHIDPTDPRSADMLRELASLVERHGGVETPSVMVPRLADDQRPKSKRLVKPKMPSQAQLQEAGVTSLDMARAKKDLAS